MTIDDRTRRAILHKQGRQTAVETAKQYGVHESTVRRIWKEGANDPTPWAVPWLDEDRGDLEAQTAAMLRLCWEYYADGREDNEGVKLPRVEISEDDEALESYLDAYDPEGDFREIYEAFQRINRDRWQSGKASERYNVKWSAQEWPDEAEREVILRFVASLYGEEGRA